MKILVDEEGKNLIYQVIDMGLRGAGIQGFNLSTKIASVMVVEKQEISKNPVEIKQEKKEK